MKVEPVDNSISFGYHNSLKTLFKKGKFPQVQFGFYGDLINNKNVTLEHVLPVSKGGKTELKNLVLASARKNNGRGNQPLVDFIDWKIALAYFDQFKGIRVRGFNGDYYREIGIQNVIDVVGKEINLLT